MDRGWWYKTIFALSVVVVCAVYLLPTFAPAGSLPGWFAEKFNKKILLGLDLQGGIHLALGVEVDKAISDKADTFAQQLKNEFAEKKIESVKLERTEEASGILFVGKTAADLSKFTELVRKEYPEFEITSQKGETATIQFGDERVQFLRRTAIEQAIKTLTNRIDQFGVGERAITRRGENTILVALPGITDPERAKALLGQTAQLEFRIVDDENDAIKKLKVEIPEGIQMDYYTYTGRNETVATEAFLKSKDKKKLQEFLKGKIPPDHHVAFGKEVHELETWFRTYLLKKKTGLTGDYLTRADVNIDQDENRPYVALTFDHAGAKMFEKITEENVKRRMAIVLDDNVDSAPIIQEKISGGSARITLGSLKPYEELLQDANDLAIVLRAGALPAPVEILEERTVGPTLGKDSVASGVRSVIVGTLLTLLFMLVYYRLSGLVADVALVLNLVMILAVMAGFEATLTLPGMAGLVLTLAMAVDANVLINERIREEVRGGKTPKAAIEIGYGKVFWTIFDSNLTTLISAVILYQFGTGPIRGFAVTLSIGIVISMYTAIVVTRLMMDRIYHSHTIERISI
jgi:preprotein translocase subunit SecD